jgi:hypothetical protein
LTGTIDPGYGMFGFDLGSLGETSPMTLSISTTLGTYTFSSLVVPNVSTGLVFEGFVAGAGEYFTSFSISSDAGIGSAPAITDVSLGSVPEPTTVLMLGIGLMGMAGLRRGRPH